MPTNGMTIDSLNTVSSLTAQDEVPVWDKEASGEPTRKIAAQNMTNSVKTLGSLVNTTEMNNAIAQSTADVIRTGDVVNNLTSTATDKPLSAAMGKFLSDHYGKILWDGSAFTSGSINVPDLDKYRVFEFFFSDTLSILVTKSGSFNIIWGGINFGTYGSDTISTIACRYASSDISKTITINSNNRGYSDGTNSNYSGKTDGLIRIVGIV